VISLGPDNALRFETGAGDGLKPYVHVRRDLWARLTRSLTHDLVALGEVQDVEGRPMFGIHAGGLFHAAMPAAGLETAE
jgi:uncharacterized protein